MGTNKTQDQTFRNKMLNKLAFASALLFGWAAAAKERYVGSCKATDLDGNPRGWAKFRQEPDSDEVFRQFVLTGFHAGEEVKVHMYNSMSEPKETWTLKADENGAVVINEKTDHPHVGRSRPCHPHDGHAPGVSRLLHSRQER